MPRPRRSKCLLSQTSARLTGRDLQQRQRGNLLKHLCQTPALLRTKKVFRRILGDAWRHHIPCSYVRDYWCPLPDVVRPIVSERYQRRTDDPLDPAIKLLNRDIPQNICQEVQAPWRSLLESFDRATNNKRCRSLLYKLEVESPTKHLNRLWRKNPLQLEGDWTSLQQGVYCLFCLTRSGHSEGYEGPPPPSWGHLLQAVWRERHYSVH